MQSGRITGNEVGKNKDGKKEVRLLQVEVTDPDDIQTIELMTQAGEDTNPPDGSTVIILKIGNAWKLAIASNDGIAPSVDKGEKKLYSSSNGTIKAFIHFLKTGELHLNGDADFAVAFTDLDNELGNLEAQLNSEFAAIASAIGALGGTYTPVPISIDISGAKVDKVKLP